MKKWFLLSILLFSALFFPVRVLSQELSEEPFRTNLQGEHIRSFQSTIKVNKDGTIDVREEMIYDFGSLERHGIFRTIPFTKTNNAEKKFRLDFSNVSVTDENGVSYQYKKTETGEILNLKIGDPDKTITGVHTYVISYRVSGALTYFSDHDELYWNVTGNDWNVPVESASARVDLPSSPGEAGIQSVCYTGYSGSSASDCQVAPTLIEPWLTKTAQFTTTKQLMTNEGLTIAVSFPKNLVAELEPKLYLSFWETFLGKITLGLIFVVILFWYLLYPLKIMYQWYRYGRDPDVTSGQARAWFDPPKTSSGRILTPEETGALVDERADQEDISGMIVHLAQKGYIKIVEKKKGDFIFVKQKEFSGPGLLPLEHDFLDSAFGNKDEVVLKRNELYAEVAEAKKHIYEKLLAEGFFLKNPESIRTFYTVIGVLALSTGNIFLSFVAFMFGRHMPRKTIAGVEAANVGRSLKNFLFSQERQLEFQAENQMIFERLLPYAIVFGVEKIWAERFKNIQMTPPEWYQGYGIHAYNSSAWVRSMNSSFSSIRSASMTPSSSSSGFSSGSSGGSSGGGGGGGGGGSW